MSTQKPNVDRSFETDEQESNSSEGRDGAIREEAETAPDAHDGDSRDAAGLSRNGFWRSKVRRLLPFRSDPDSKPDTGSEKPPGAVAPTASEDELHEVVLEGEDSARPTARERTLPQDEFLIYDRLTRESTLAQDTLGFDYVRGDGIIVAGTDYIGLVQVQPRNWLVLNDAERTAVFRAFMSFLLGLKYPVQIAAVPHEFDISKHTEKIRIADSMAKRNEESPILRHGRRRQVAWMYNTIDTMSVKDRDFYVVTRVHSFHLETKQRSSRFGGVPVLGDLVNGFSTSLLTLRPRRRRAIGQRTEERCVKEVRARQNELSETLTKTGVSTRIVSDRNEAMDVLYQHYNHVESPFTTYNHATYTKLLSNALSDRSRS